MTFLYAAQYSFVLLRPKIEIKLSTQSADKRICIGKWPVSCLAEFIHHVILVRFVSEFFSPTRTVPQFWENQLWYTTNEGAGAKKIKN